MNIQFTTLCSLLVSALPLASQGYANPELDLPVAEIPMDISTSHVAVEVFIGSGEPLAFNLDTYALYPACVDQRFAKRMGFEKIGTVTNGDGSGKTFQRDTVLIPELRFGDVTFRGVHALVDDYSWVSTPQGGSIDGLLGYPLFRELLLELDYPAQMVRLRRGTLPKDGEHVISHPALRTRPDIPLRIGAMHLTVGIDTGADSGLLLSSSMLEQVSLLEPARRMGRAKTVYSEAEIMAGRLSEPLLLAGHSLPEVRATFSDLFGKPLIGHDLLASYAVTFDQKHGRVRFAEPAGK